MSKTKTKTRPTRPTTDELAATLERARQAAACRNHTTAVDNAVHIIRAAAKARSHVTLNAPQVAALALHLEGQAAARQVRALASERAAEAAVAAGADNVVAFPGA